MTNNPEELMKYIRDNLHPNEEQDFFISMSLVDCNLSYYNLVREQLIKEMEERFNKK